MTDKLTQEQRHRNMVAIRGKGTKPEILVRKFLFSRGFRYRLNHPRLPGHPDLVLRKYRTVIFVNGCFWHGHENCKYFRLPKTNIDFWQKKIERNKERDKKTIFSLRIEKSKHMRYLNLMRGLWRQNQGFRMRKLKTQNMCNSFPLIVVLRLKCLIHK